MQSGYFLNLTFKMGMNKWHFLKITGDMETHDYIRAHSLQGEYIISSTCVLQSDLI